MELQQILCHGLSNFKAEYTLIKYSEEQFFHVFVSRFCFYCHSFLLFFSCNMRTDNFSRHTDSIHFLASVLESDFLVACLKILN